MATQPQDLAAPATQEYDAHAYVLSADLQQPVPSIIDPQFKVTLPKEGTYQYQTAPAYKLYGVLSYESGYTQVSGHPSSKRDGFTTLATSVVEGLNVLDVVTADRVVGQVSTTRPYDGAVPSVTFLGTRFVNLRIGGHPVEVHQDLHILGPKPAGDMFYLDDPGVQSRMSQQYSKIQSEPGLPQWAAEQFQWENARTQLGRQGSCSLVNGTKGSPGQSFGHIIDLPHFGRIFLGEVSVDRTPPPPNSDQYETYTFHLRMVRLEMGCIGAGSLTAVALDSNGQGSGGGHHPAPPPPPPPGS